MELWTTATPNGWKVSIMIEELRDAGVDLGELTVRQINLAKGEQHTAEFSAHNPNEKIPVLIDEGRSIMYISHKLDEVSALCDRATILRGGQVVGHCDPVQETATSLAEMMIGERLIPAAAADSQAGYIRLEAQDLRLASE